MAENESLRTCAAPPLYRHTTVSAHMPKSHQAHLEWTPSRLIHWAEGIGTATAELARRLRAAHLKERGVIEDVDYQHPRGLDRKLVRTLSSSDWVRQHQSILLLEPTGIGKTWLACALAQKACRDGFSILRKRTSELFRELAVAHADGSIRRLLLRLSRIDVLLLDDFAMAPLKDAERRDFWRSAMTAISAAP